MPMLELVAAAAAAAATTTASNKLALVAPVHASGWGRVCLAAQRRVWSYVSGSVVALAVWASPHAGRCIRPFSQASCVQQALRSACMA